MKAALSLRCSADHPHELVQGAATAASAMYSPRLAQLVANVIHPTSPPSVSKIGGGGGGQNRSFLCEGTRVGKENEARFAPGLQPWYQPLKELGGLPHQFKGSHLANPPGEKASRACRRYLQFLKEETFSQAGFKKAAELGTEFLRLADGWEEACRALRRTWIEDQGDHFQQLHGTFFEGLVDEGLLEKARSNAIQGSTRTPPTKEVRGSGVPLTPA